MGDFFRSKFIQDLQQGKLPEVRVVVSHESLYWLFGGAFITAIAILLVAKILKSV